MKKILVAAVFAATALVIGCSSSSESTPAATDAGAKSDAGKSDAATSQTDSATPTVPDAGPPSLGTDGSVTSDGGTCGFNTAGPAEAYTGTDDNGDPVWLFYGNSADAALSIENYAGFGGPTTPAPYTLVAADESYETCAFCIILRTGCTATSCAHTYMPLAGGTVNLTALGAVGGQFTGDLSGVQLREVNIDPNSFATTTVDPDAGGSTQCLSGVRFDGLLDDVANMP
jgi:hypothetical protein